MATFTIVSTPTEDTFFAQGRTIYNTQNGTTLTGAQFFDLIAREPARAYCQELIHQQGLRDRATQLAAWDAASQATKDQIKTLLGL